MRLPAPREPVAVTSATAEGTHVALSNRANQPLWFGTYRSSKPARTRAIIAPRNARARARVPALRASRSPGIARWCGGLLSDAHTMSNLQRTPGALASRWSAVASGQPRASASAM